MALFSWPERHAGIGQVLGGYAVLMDEHRPSPGSALVGDDRKVPGHAVHEVAWFGIASAFQHVSAVQREIPTAGPRWRPLFTLARSAILSASRSIWILLPATRLDRVSRSLSVAVEDERQRRKMLSSARFLADFAEGARLELAEPDARLTELNRLQGKLGIRRAGYNETIMVEVAAQALDRRFGPPSAFGHEFSLTNFSAHAHAHPWGSLGVESFEAVGMSLLAPPLALELAVNLYKERAAIGAA
jgi:hypothetical protein